MTARTKFRLAIVILLLGAVSGMLGCFAFRGPRTLDVPPLGRQITMEVTAYCACQKCCGWKRNWLGMPVFGSGHLKGKRKKVGVCADGSKAKHGTIAADTDFYPFGTRIYVPGYGVGTVHDRGSAIQGMHRLDLFFRKHDDAIEWGRQQLIVVVLDD
jgi:3D (Asp-Asp-Asp) domain-containing protein